MSEDIAIEMARTAREALARVEAKLAAEQLGECFNPEENDA